MLEYNEKNQSLVIVLNSFELFENSKVILLTGWTGHQNIIPLQIYTCQICKEKLFCDFQMKEMAVYLTFL